MRMWLKSVGLPDSILLDHSASLPNFFNIEARTTVVLLARSLNILLKPSAAVIVESKSLMAHAVTHCRLRVRNGSPGICTAIEKYGTRKSNLCMHEKICERGAEGHSTHSVTVKIPDTVVNFRGQHQGRPRSVGTSADDATLRIRLSSIDLLRP